MKKSLLPVLFFATFGMVLHAQDATRGGTLYKQQCASCHGEGLEGRSGPSLASGDFRSRWPTPDLTDKIRNTRLLPDRNAAVPTSTIASE